MLYINSHSPFTLTCPELEHIDHPPTHVLQWGHWQPMGAGTVSKSAEDRTTWGHTHTHTAIDTSDCDTIGQLWVHWYWGQTPVCNEAALELRLFVGFFKLFLLGVELED